MSTKRLIPDEVRAHLDDRRVWSIPLNEKRSVVSIESRSDSDKAGEASAEKVLTGYAAVFDSNSEPIMGMFTERIQRGAFKNVLSKNPDVRLLVNHAGLPFARTTNDTLKISEEPRGLAYRAVLANTPEADSLHELVSRGDVDQNSFAFRVARGGDVWECPCGDPLGMDCRCTASQVVRTITEVSDLYELSVVTFPAYSSTSVTIGSENESSVEQNAQATDAEQRDKATETGASDLTLNTDHAEAIRSWLIAIGGNQNESESY
jgi:HK97 family phage prohead protease